MEEDCHWTTPPSQPDIRAFGSRVLQVLYRRADSTAVQVPWHPDLGCVRLRWFTWVPGALQAKQPLHSPPRGGHRCRPPQAVRGRDGSRAQLGTTTRFLPGKGPLRGYSRPAAACLEFITGAFGEETTNNPLFLHRFEMSHLALCQGSVCFEKQARGTLVMPALERL